MPYVEYPKGHKFYDGKGLKRWVNTYHKGDIIHATHNIKDSEKVCHETKLVTTLGFVVSEDKVYHQVQYFYCAICNANIEDKDYLDVDDRD